MATSPITPACRAHCTTPGNKWLSRLPGNLACGTIAACAGFGAICGSCAATCATMGTIALPEMRNTSTRTGSPTGSIAMGGTLGILIPPSTPMILYASWRKPRSAPCSRPASSPAS
jgi:TRAP-type C4-dicarboxylate transport system permease large subunit